MSYRELKRVRSNQMKGKSFYHAFEDRFRGSRELIKSRLRIYLPFVIPLKAIYDDCRVIDLGCGRGEWLELMADEGFEAHGVDLDESMLAAHKAEGLSVTKADAMEYLQALHNDSVVLVSGFHIIEHIAFESLQKLVSEAFRVLRPGGLLILETPNPESLSVSTTEFYLDPTHRRPIPPKLLYFLADYNNFVRIKLLRLQESPLLYGSNGVNVTDIFFGVSPDYAIVAQKSAQKEQMSLFDKAFNEEYGLTVDDLALRYANKDQQLFAYERERWQWLESELSAAKVRFDMQAVEIPSLRDRAAQLDAQLSASKDQVAQLDAQLSASKDQVAQLSERSQALESERKRAEWLDRELQSVHSSICWRITAPMRAGFDLYLGAKANLSAIPQISRRKIGSIISPLLIGSIHFAKAHPSLKAQALKLVHMYPRLDAWLYSFVVSKGLVDCCTRVQISSHGFSESSLSPYARRIYGDLKDAMEKYRKEGF
jgi:O-antigen chain-terminating methyltransferase